MGQRFGSPTGTHEAGSEEEFEWALDSYLQTGFPEIKWFFRKVAQFVAPSADAKDIQEALEQWTKVQSFKKRLQQGIPRYGRPPLFYKVRQTSVGVTRCSSTSARAMAAPP